MILKVRSYDESIEGGWTFICDVAEIRTSAMILRMSKKRGPTAVDVEYLGFFQSSLPQRLSEGQYEVGYRDPDKVCLPSSLKKDIMVGKQVYATISTVYIVSKNGTHQTVAFHEAYLLNDIGKTIERL